MAKVALITGASRGIGRATALLAARQGYDVCINFVTDAAAATSVAEECRGHGVNATTCRGDVADSQDVDALFRHCDDALGPVYILVNNAGIVGQASRLEHLSEQALRATFDINVLGSIYCAQQAVRRMSTARGGSGGVIVNLSSVAAVSGSPNEYVHYAASKAAI